MKAATKKRSVICQNFCFVICKIPNSTLSNRHQTGNGISFGDDWMPWEIGCKFEKKKYLKVIFLIWSWVQVFSWIAMTVGGGECVNGSQKSNRLIVLIGSLIKSSIQQLFSHFAKNNSFWSSKWCSGTELQRIVNMDRIPNIFVFETLMNTE